MTTGNLIGVHGALRSRSLPWHWLTLAVLVGGYCSPASDAPAVQAVLNPPFAWESDATDPDVLRATHPSQGYIARLGSQGAELTIGRERVILGPLQARCGDKLLGAVQSRAKARRGSAATRASYDRDPLTEWYENGLRGLEQGVNLSRLPSFCKPGEPLSVEMPVQGLRAQRKSGAMSLVNAGGTVVLWYTELVAKDATGKLLASRLSTDDQGSKIRIETDLSGATFPVEIDPLIWTQQQKIHAFDAASGDTLGTSLALSGDGNTAIVGSWKKSSAGLSQNGGAYVYIRVGGGWTLQQLLEPTDAASGDYFGGNYGAIALSTDGNTALIGAYGKSDSPYTGNGDAYVFVRSGGHWTQQQKLRAMDPASGDQFGMSAALSGDGNTALVSACVKSDPGLSYNGDAYVFVRTNGKWTQQQKLQSSDLTSYDGFGCGGALTADGNTALIGAFTKSVSDYWTGQAYIFTRSGGTWSQQQILQSLDLAKQDQFGTGVALSADGSIALVGALGKTNGPFTFSGDAYIFTRSNGRYTQLQKLQASDRGSGDFFGNFCALSADGTIGLVGAPRHSDSGLTGNGAAYLFARGSGGYTQQQELQGADQGSGDAFGAFVSLSADGQTALSGSQGHSDDPLTNNGDAYVFQSSGRACAAASDCVSGYCVDGVCCNTACGGGDPGDCQACSVTAGALVDGVCALLPATTVCHSAAGDCDLPAACTGISPSCPNDTVAPPSQICRPSIGPSDPAEFCDGVAKTCPPDVNDSSGCSYGTWGTRPSATWPLLGLFVIPLLIRSRRNGTQRRASHAAFGLLGLALSQCGIEPLVVLDLDPATIPAGARTLQVLTVTDGVPAPVQPIDVIKERIAIYLPGQLGATNLEVDALDINGCKLAAAEVSYPVPAGLSQAIEAPLALIDFQYPACTLALTIKGSGAVTSSPAGMTCIQAGTCSADFPLDQSVTLYPAGSKTPAWTGCDSIAGSACMLTANGSRQVGVTF